MIKEIAVGIVTYNSELDRLKQNISAVIGQVERIIIVDNGSSNISAIKDLLAQYGSFITTIENGRNLGIASALNTIMSKALCMGYTWCLTLDQDSVVSENFVENLYEKRTEDCAILCPLVRDINKSGFIQFSGTQELKECITSGSLSRISAWSEISGFDESMFIDGVDFDYCIRLRKAGWRILQVGDVVLEHEIGHITERYFMGRKVIVRNHSAFRKYYIARNVVYLDRKHRLQGYPITTNLRIVKLCLVTIAYESDKWKKVFAILRGAADGWRAKIST